MAETPVRVTHTRLHEFVVDVLLRDRLPTFTPATRVSAPLKLSPVTNETPLVIV